MAKPSKKRKSLEAPAASEEVVVVAKEAKVTKGSGTTKAKSPSKQPPTIAASASVMMNFLQPRKKPKSRAASSPEVGRHEQMERLSPVVMD